MTVTERGYIMGQSIVVSLFEVESEAYQAMTQLKQNPGDENSFVSAAALVKKENDRIQTLDAFDSGAHTTDDTAIGGLMGAMFGVLGGPIGVLLGGSYGMLLGSAVDAGDALTGVSLLEQIEKKLEVGDVAILALAFEEDETVLDQKLSGFKTTIARYEAEVVAAEVEEAQMMEKEMARLARKELRDEKKATRKEKMAQKKEKLSAEWEEFKGKFKKQDA